MLTAESCVKQQPVTLIPGSLPETHLVRTVFMQNIFSDTQDSCDYSPGCSAFIHIYLTVVNIRKPARLSKSLPFSTLLI